jgi:hypothetical protein
MPTFSYNIQEVFYNEIFPLITVITPWSRVLLEQLNYTRNSNYNNEFVCRVNVVYLQPINMHTMDNVKHNRSSGTG